MNITLFGGSFDPPHNGHLKIAQTLIERKYSDEVWFVPCAQHPYNKNLSPALLRLAMIERLMDFNSDKSMFICTYELEKTTTSYSVETLEYFSKIQPTDTFSWVIGSDHVEDFHKWHRYQDILDNFTVFVYPRYGYKVNKLHKGMVLIENVEEIDLSSTKIKELLQSNQLMKKHIEKYTSVEVLDYIKENNLYKK